MNFEVKTTALFQKNMKRLVKKYPSLKTEYAKLIEQLEKEPQTGIPLGNNCFKIRISIASKGKGKSGGARVITFVQIFKSTVTLLKIFDKSEIENISDTELNLLLQNIPE